MKRFMFALFLMLLLLGAEQSAVLVYDSEVNTSHWEWDADDAGFEIVIGLDREKWITGINQLDFLDTNVRTMSFDYSKEVPILVYLGQRPSGGYAVNIDQIFKREQDTVIVVSRRSPKPTEFVTMVLTYPYDFLVVPRQYLVNQHLVVIDQHGNVLRRYENAFPSEERAVYEISVLFQKKEGKDH